MTTIEHAPKYLGPKAELIKYRLKLLSQAALALFAQEVTKKPEHTHSPIILKIDLSKTDGYNSTDEQVLQQELTKKHLFGREFGYTAFPTFLAETTLKTGTYYDQNDKNIDPNQMWLCLLSADGQNIVADEYSLVDYLTSSSEDMATSCFAVYDLSHFTQGDAEFHYQFKNPKEKRAALRAIVHVRL